MKKVVKKYWRIKLEVNRDKTVTKEYDHDPTKEDIQLFADSMNNFIGNVSVETFWKISHTDEK